MGAERKSFSDASYRRLVMHVLIGHRRHLSLMLMACIVAVMCSCLSYQLMVSMSEVQVPEDCEMTHMIGALYECKERLMIFVGSVLSISLIFGMAASMAFAYKVLRQAAVAPIPDRVFECIADDAKVDCLWKNALADALQDHDLCLDDLRQMRAMQVQGDGKRDREDLVRQLRQQASKGDREWKDMPHDRGTVYVDMSSRKSVSTAKFTMPVGIEIRKRILRGEEVMSNPLGGTGGRYRSVSTSSYQNKALVLDTRQNVEKRHQEIVSRRKERLKTR